MKKKSPHKILHEYFDAQNKNFISHLERQENNFQEHFKILENLFSDNSNNNFNNIEYNLHHQKSILENNIKKENNDFKNQLESQKRKTNKLLSKTNIYIPNNSNNNINNINNNQYRINYIRNRNNINNNEKDKTLEYKKQKAILALPSFQYRYIIKYEKRDEKNCPICLNDFKSEDILIRFSCKEHIFHQTCLLKWLEESNICPMCKKSLNIY